MWGMGLLGQWSSIGRYSDLWNGSSPYCASTREESGISGSRQGRFDWFRWAIRPRSLLSKSTTLSCSRDMQWTSITAETTSKRKYVMHSSMHTITSGLSGRKRSRSIQLICGRGTKRRKLADSKSTKYWPSSRTRSHQRAINGSS